MLKPHSDNSNPAMILSSHQQNHVSHLVVLGFCVVMLMGAFVLGNIDWYYENTTKGNLPGICILKNATGIPCPGCGLTRSWLTMINLDFNKSYEFHRFGWLVMFYIFLQFFRHLLWLIFKSNRPYIEKIGKWLDRSLILLAGILIIDWLFTLKYYFISR